MELNDDQKKRIVDWIDQGLGLADIQRQLQEEMGFAMTYMDVRFLVLDLGLEVKDKEMPTTAVAQDAATQTDDDYQPDDAAFPETRTIGSSVSVEVDRVMKPGSIVSGTVVFSDGVKASWALDQFGRLALDADQPGYTPGKEDVAAFQKELRAALEKRGF